MIELNKFIKEHNVYDKLDYCYYITSIINNYQTSNWKNHIFVWKEKEKKKYINIKKIMQMVKVMVKQDMSIMDRYSAYFYAILK